jgi:PadR family transcriptional regulator, regulatory protein PadR
MRIVSSKRASVPRLSGKEHLVLELLAGARPQYGLELVAASRGRLKRGTVYVTLGRMEDKGYVTSRTEHAPDGAGGLPRRLYEATPYGLRVLKAWTTLLHHLAPEPAR